jgi:hypothetical protein
MVAFPHDIGTHGDSGCPVLDMQGHVIGSFSGDFTAQIGTAHHGMQLSAAPFVFPRTAPHHDTNPPMCVFDCIAGQPRQVSYVEKRETLYTPLTGSSATPHTRVLAVTSFARPVGRDYWMECPHVLMQSNKEGIVELFALATEDDSRAGPPTQSQLITSLTAVKGHPVVVNFRNNLVIAYNDEVLILQATWNSDASKIYQQLPARTVTQLAGKSDVRWSFFKGGNGLRLVAHVGSEQSFLVVILTPTNDLAGQSFSANIVSSWTSLPKDLPAAPGPLTFTTKVPDISQLQRKDTSEEWQAYYLAEGGKGLVRALYRFTPGPVITFKQAASVPGSGSVTQAPVPVGRWWYQWNTLAVGTDDNNVALFDGEKGTIIDGRQLRLQSAPAVALGVPAVCRVASSHVARLQSAFSLVNYHLSSGTALMTAQEDSTEIILAAAVAPAAGSYVVSQSWALKLVSFDARSACKFLP